MATAQQRQQRPAGNRRVVKRTRPWLPPVMGWVLGSFPDSTHARVFAGNDYGPLSFFGIPPMVRNSANTELPIGIATAAGGFILQYSTPGPTVNNGLFLRTVSFEVRGQFGAVLGPGSAVIPYPNAGFPQQAWTVQTRATFDVTVSNGSGGSVTYVADPGEWFSEPSHTAATSCVSSPTTFILSFGVDISADIALSFAGHGIGSWCSNGTVMQAGSHLG